MNRRPAWIAWAVAVTVIVTAAVPVTVAITQGKPGSEVLSTAAWALVSSVFAVSAAIILSRQPGNVIGWLLMIPAVNGAVADNVIKVWTDTIVSAPPEVGPGLLVSLVFHGYSWVLLIFPLFHLLQVFPTGTPPSDGWRWFLRLEYAMATFFLTVLVLAAELGPADERWSVANPIGVIPMSFFESATFVIVWTIGLLVLALGGASSVVTRYRRSRGEERLQLKWLLYAFSQFVVIYTVMAVLQGWIEETTINLLFIPSILAIPVVITMAVVRRGLFGIDRVISRTVSYAMLLGVLLGVYAAGIGLLTRALPAQSDLAVAASTLAVAALFTPLRRSIQRRVDRRFNRNRYQAEAELTALSDRLHDLADIDVIATDLISVAGRTLQPASVAVWIAAEAHRPRTPPVRP